MTSASAAIGIAHLSLTWCALFTLGACDGGGFESSVSVGGTVVGLTGTGLVLRNNGSDDLAVSVAGSFTFASKIANGAAYTVTVHTQPTNPDQHCTVTNGTGSGTAAAANITTVAIVCADVGRFAYVANGADMSAYKIDANTGALATVVGSPFPVQTTSAVIDPNGKFLYALDLVTASSIYGYTIDAGTGALTQVTGGPLVAEQSVISSMVIAPSGQTLYLSLAAYGIDPDTGVLAALPISPPVSGGIYVPAAAAFDPIGRFLYVANGTTAGGLYAYSVNNTSGSLTPVVGAPYATGTTLITLTVDARGRFVYAISDSVLAYTLDAATGALTPVLGSPFAAGIDPISVTCDPSGTYLYVANYNGGGGGASFNSVSAFRIDATTGALTPVAGSPFATGAQPIAVKTDPSGKFLYVANESDATVSAFAIDTNTGALTAVPGSPFAAGHYPLSLVVSK